MKILTTYAPMGKVRYLVDNNNKLTLLEDRMNWEAWDRRSIEDISFKMQEEFNGFIKECKNEITR